MSRVYWVETAEEARDKALEYIAQYSLDAALAQFDEIDRQTERLLKFPHLGRPSPVKGARELSINRTNFVVAYRVIGENIQITRFLHTSQKQ